MALVLYEAVKNSKSWWQLCAILIVKKIKCSTFCDNSREASGQNKFYNYNGDLHFAYKEIKNKEEKDFRIYQS